ncbi:MFS multidrug transporter [Cordyceps militaris CM01]|uniref:MFS multidrug transporter n=1 Tax=Cordyceps militaris (strain CM01) TaxID=983644 RepID=G3JAQ7_CORMM|nr:MFS multidrug transporter [Cordyceps militaris CM01]EGX95172.1 MFS multidrug transporter [Cordyceps militaris CM01]
MLPSKPELLSAHSQNVAALLSLDTLGNRALLKASLLAAGLTDAQSSALCLTLPPPRPSQWPLRKKLTVLLGPYLAAALAAYSAGAYALAAAPLRAAWHVSETAYAVGITIFVSAFGFAPMVLAPVSEAHGRYWVFVGAGAVFFLGTLGCAVTAGYAGMLVSRFVTGMGASVFATLTGGVVADVYDREARNTPMALYSLMIMAGTGLGPLVSGVVVDALGWRWIFYLQMMLIAATLALILVLFEETRANVVLARLCHALNKQLAETHPASRLRFHPSVVQETLDIGLVYRSFVFPLRLLVAEPVVLCFSLIGIVFRGVYGFSSRQVGLVFVAVVAASCLSACLAITQGPVLRRLWPHRAASTTPESRLLSTSVQSVLLPAGLFWFGWTASPEVHWIFPALAVGACTMGIFSIYLAVFNYLADTYGRYSSSAQAAQSMCRNLLAGIFPLFTHIMLRNLTYHGTGSLLGGLGLALTAVPWLLSFFGPQIRAKSPFAKTVMEE